MSSVIDCWCSGRTGPADQEENAMMQNSNPKAAQLNQGLMDLADGDGPRKEIRRRLYSAASDTLSAGPYTVPEDLEHLAQQITALLNLARELEAETAER